MRRFFNFIKDLLIVAILAAVALNYQDQLKTLAYDVSGEVSAFLTEKGIQTGNLGLSDGTILEAKATKTTKNTTGYTWKKPTATVYVNLKQADLYNATINAMAAWNQTGAFTFKQTKNRNKAQIVVTTASKSDGAAGLTTYKYYSGLRRLYSAKVALNTYYLENSYYNYTQARIVNTVEHELGHAIGLDHRSGVTVMYPTGSIYSIQPKDVALVKKIYKGRH
ncbi:MAG: matrixin family metalloprotease [Lactobacillus equicursoris]|uniref:matrixin family metalloprotease n=1 Tax=Lactobacillus equicursoris TaxID=420645 RepID=UPI00242B219D|nr:matrixin family metalloprotease [Lactobacillus equicursoris]MDD6408103.1 matrixin family metalloprotease [Lactobacillus equicursoris]